MALVTVIVPNYNHGRFLEKRINSILQQTWQDFELIILDDASTDDSCLVIEKYRNHPKVKAIVYNEQNGGSPFLQWQKGIGLATGEWIWLAESDDYCYPEFLASVTPAFYEPACVLSYAEISWVNENEKVLKFGPTQAPRWYYGSAFLKSKMLYEDYLVNAGMVVFRRSAINQVDPAWLQMKQAGDYWFWCEVARQGKVYACGQPLCYFTRHQNATSNRFQDTNTQRLENLAVLDQMLIRGSINKVQYRAFFLHQLVALQTQKKSHHAFKTYYDFWLEQAAIRNLKPGKMEIAIPAFARKVKHYIKIR